MQGAFATVETSGSAWPFENLNQIADTDGYRLRAADGALTSEANGGDLAAVVPILSVTNLEQSLTYYLDGLGFEEVDRLSEEDQLLACRLRRDNVFVVLTQDRGTAVERKGQGVTVYHMCNDAIAFYREVTSRGIAVSEPFVGNGLWVAELRDPDGYRLSFESPTDAPEEQKLSDV